MPFDSVNFQDTLEAGDLLYGRHEVRNDYINRNIFPPLKAELPKLKESYQQYIIKQGGLYTLLSSYAGNQDSYHKTMGEGTIYNVKLHDKSNFYDKKAQAFQTRRKCKRGIFGHVLKKHDGERKPQLHFLLDGIDFNEVQRKRKPTPHMTLNYVTDSELRWIFRWRQVHEVQQRIQFWNNNQPCIPPWGENQSITSWGTYRPKRPPNCYRTLFDLVASKINTEEKDDPNALERFFEKDG